MDKADKRSVVVLDIDGVVNSYSNQKFYARFIYSAMRNLAKIHGRRKLLQAWPKMQKCGGANALFKFARIYSGNEQRFNDFTKRMVEDLNFEDIPYDASVSAMLKRLQNYGEITVRSDGLTAIAAAVWQRVIENRPADEIKKELLAHESLPKQITINFEKHSVNISGIEDNDMETKTNIKSWQNFSERYNIDLSRSVLIDDSKSNNKVAEQLGMKTILVSKLDSFLQKMIFHGSQNKTLSDILGTPVSEALRRCKLAYGQKVDMALLFSVITDYPKKQLLQKLKKAKLNQDISPLVPGNWLKYKFKKLRDKISYCYSTNNIPDSASDKLVTTPKNKPVENTKVSRFFHVFKRE